MKDIPRSLAGRPDLPTQIRRSRTTLVDAAATVAVAWLVGAFAAAAVTAVVTSRLVGAERGERPRTGEAPRPHQKP